ncbi:MAG TPA: CAP domain-containing protein [Actinomycetota bacterium]|nr:CAP domain-containing protein [Actinomycetota bacterium]
MSRGHAGIRRGGGALAGLLLVLALLTTGLVTDHARAAEDVPLRDKMLTLTNQDREEHDEKALKLNAKLSRYAARHSADMAEEGELVHTSVDALVEKLNDLGIEWSTAGENIGVGSSLRTVQKAFMRSTLHRQNILNGDYDHAATGVFEAPDGSFWVTVIFYG